MNFESEAVVHRMESMFEAVVKHIKGPEMQHLEPVHGEKRILRLHRMEDGSFVNVGPPSSIGRFVAMPQQNDKPTEELLLQRIQLLEKLIKKADKDFEELRTNYYQFYYKTEDLTFCAEEQAKDQAHKNEDLQTEVAKLKEENASIKKKIENLKKQKNGKKSVEDELYTLRNNMAILMKQMNPDADDSLLAALINAVTGATKEKVDLKVLTNVTNTGKSQTLL